MHFPAYRESDRKQRAAPFGQIGHRTRREKTFSTPLPHRSSSALPGSLCLESVPGTAPSAIDRLAWRLVPVKAGAFLRSIHVPAKILYAGDSLQSFPHTADPAVPAAATNPVSALRNSAHHRNVYYMLAIASKPPPLWMPQLPTDTAFPIHPWGISGKVP